MGVAGAPDRRKRADRFPGAMAPVVTSIITALISADRMACGAVAIGEASVAACAPARGRPGQQQRQRIAEIVSGIGQERDGVRRQAIDDLRDDQRETSSSVAMAKALPKSAGTWLCVCPSPCAWVVVVMVVVVVMIVCHVHAYMGVGRAVTQSHAA